jgi:PKD repeat protein
MVDATSSSNTTTSTTYDWNFGDGSTGSGATASHTYLANGTYNVSLIVTGECGSDTIVVPITIAGISVSELPLDRSLNVYPNPTSGVVRIDFELEVPQQVEIQVVNTIGQVVLKRTLNSSLGVQMEHLDLSSCAAGIYHLQVNTDEGVVTRRVAVQK